MALVPSAKVEAFIGSIKSGYFEGLEAAKDRDLDQLVFQTKPGQGAFIMEC